MKRYLLTLLAALALAACGKSASDDQQHSDHQSANADATSNRGQAQEPQASPKEPDAGEKGDALYYRHPMGFPDTSPVPKKDSMGMDYIPVYENEAAGGGNAVVVAPETIQTIGVKIEPVKEIDFGRTIRTFGAVADNARLLTEVTSRVDGWIDELVITAVGDEVSKGDLIFRLRSPDLIAAKRDYVTALNSGSSSWAASSATRLKSLGVQDQTIAEIRARRTADELTPFYAERDGIVSVLNVRTGAFIESGDQIATLADYGEVWVIASIAEQDLPLINTGASAVVTFPNTPASARPATVDYVYPTVDSKTRTGKARIVLDNPNLALRPGAYADVSFEIESRSRLAVPSEAILRDQRGAHVIMAMGEGRFMPMPVKTGLIAAAFTEIVEGLNVGDPIVVSGQFLIDSESNLKESLGKLTAGGHAGHGTGPASDDGDRADKKSEAEPSAHQHDDDGSQL